MQHSTREKALFAFVVASLIFCVFMFLATTKTIVNVSAVEAHGVGVYWDSDCNNTVTEINWGTLNPGSVKNVTVYILNKEAKPMYLILSTQNWTPPEASEFLNLGWNYTARRMNPGEVLQITLTLSVSRYVEDISSFSFDIRMHAYACDVNGDGRVSVADLVQVDVALGSQPSDPNWNPYADVDGDGRVSVADMAQVDVALES